LIPALVKKQVVQFLAITSQVKQLVSQKKQLLANTLEYCPGGQLNEHYVVPAIKK
jgi:hypothetical protein